MFPMRRHPWCLRRCRCPGRHHRVAVHRVVAARGVVAGGDAGWWTPTETALLRTRERRRSPVRGSDGRMGGDQCARLRPVADSFSSSARRGNSTARFQESRDQVLVQDDERIHVAARLSYPPCPSRQGLRYVACTRSRFPSSTRSASRRRDPIPVGTAAIALAAANTIRWCDALQAFAVGEVMSRGVSAG